ncbi:hypothetical protein [Comamonas testosteroni]|uniref:hypothetical protein n=1 Tax=Comamonas testosteroni TaxID=285 RepID=UPI001E61B4C6|nr:hypothetical protein [Comamonas testosteroni]
MIIELDPIRSDDELSIAVKGDSVALNGKVFDFSGLADGEVLLQADIDCPWLSGNVSRVNGQLTIRVLFPHGVAASDAARFPVPIIVAKDGPVELPPRGHVESHSPNDESDGQGGLDEWVPTLEEQVVSERARLKRLVDAEYVNRMNVIALPYPQYERESWPIQLGEAQALALGAGAITPWIDACAAQRGMGRIELMQRILAKDVAYRLLSGQLTGARQAHEDMINGLIDLEALCNYDVSSLWP